MIVNDVHHLNSLAFLNQQRKRGTKIHNPCPKHHVFIHNCIINTSIPSTYAMQIFH